ncbi:PREDICTED: uncharacterized protein LOC101295107 [Fragaria vesca subsp. vesca]|uniref:uncharacterized protein LOC101295107 n=1 Tax=Fragaria vesca subsp. vesca TaxID=101020 RepID=UPI0002C35685|nr:PREDICTED: uncharacterized protein LOC101295107 [Fragaria vesca subsp. vesca]
MGRPYPKDLWDVLKQRFYNIHDVLIPELTARWESIRLMDFAKVEDYNQAMLDLQLEISFCGVDKIDKDLIEKTLYTFSSSMSSHQYRLKYEQNCVTSFSNLICMLAKKERHQEIILNNNARPVGTKKILESNQASRATLGGVMTEIPPPPRNNIRGRGLQGEKSGQGRNPPSNSNQKRRSPCYMCGSIAHLHHDCHASKEAIDTYRRHKQYLAQEANFTGGDDIGAEPSTNLTIADFEAKKRASHAHMDAADFDELF